jgi:putative tryptophan/tyrosine transport system substrate-binding protein
MGLKRCALIFLCVFTIAGAMPVLQADAASVIGISKIVAHPALDAVEQGIQDELKSLGHTLNYDLQNANGEIGTAASIAAKFRSSKVAVAVGIATPTSQALVNAIKDIPVVFSAVTDPVGAGLVGSLSKGEGNVTGVSDLTPVKQQIEMLMRFKPIKRLGHVYSSHESNAVALADLARKACQELGIDFVETTVTNSAEVKQAVQTIIRRIDALYVSTDNTVVSALSAVTDVTMEHKVPVMSADPSSAEKFDVLAAWGFDYYRMGRATGRMIDEILNGRRPEDIPTLFMTDPADVDLLINLDVAARLGLTVPPDILALADTLIKDGAVQKK